MMKEFLIEKNQIFNYNRLFSDINKAKYYYNTLITNELYKHFLNLIVALLSNKNLTLLDADMNSAEILSLDINLATNIKEKIATLHLESLDKLIELILNSTSEISIFTSGTTGQPKKVIHSIKTLTRSVKRSSMYENQVWGFAYNPTHMAGLQVFFQGFLNQNTFINLFNSNRIDIYSCIKTYKITNISATPTFYRLLLPIENQYPTVTRVTLGGEKSDNKLYEAIQKIFPNAKINNIYASTEAASLFIAAGEYFHIPDKIKDKVKIDDGELLLHKSLLGKSDSFIFECDYYRTGDLIEWKDSNLFKFKSRKNELINVGGYKVNPGEVEDALYKIVGLYQVKVYGKPNSVLGNVLCADVQLDSNFILQESDIRKILAENLQDYKIPRIINFVNNFDLTKTGKIKRV